MKIVSWNVNGLARCRRNGFLKFLSDAISQKLEKLLKQFVQEHGL